MLSAPLAAEAANRTGDAGLTVHQRPVALGTAVAGTGHERAQGGRHGSNRVWQVAIERARRSARRRRRKQRELKAVEAIAPRD